MKLKLYADRSYLPAGTNHVLLLFPFWGHIPEAPGDKDEGRFDDYTRLGREFFEIVPNLAEADAALLPFEWRPGSPEHVAQAQRLAEAAQRLGKKVIVFFNNDSAERIPIANALIFRTSFFRSTRQPNEYAIPGWSVDFVPRYLKGQLPVREKGAVPVVGYCGYVDFDFGTPKSLLLYLARRLAGRKIKPGASLRGSAVRVLRRCRGVAVNYVYRTDFCGTGDPAVREQYVQNIVDSDYALVTRGVGNFSYRLYEVMSCGRIPVLVDTDCVLPYDHLIDWKKYCVWVDVAELDQLGTRVAAFHERISPEAFRELQVNIRRIYEEWLSPDGFHRNLWRCLVEGESCAA